MVAIDSWEADSAYPAGHYVRTLGPIGDRETETEVGPGRSLRPCPGGLPCPHPSHRVPRMNRISMMCEAVSRHYGARRLQDWLMHKTTCKGLQVSMTLCMRQVLLLENDINTAPFSQAVHGCVPPLPWAVTEDDVADPNRCDPACVSASDVTCRHGTAPQGCCAAGAARC